MRYGTLACWVLGLSVTAGVAALDCGGDDTSGTGSTTSSTIASGGTAGAGGTATGGTAAGGSAGSGGTATGTAGSAGRGGTAGTAGSAGSPGDASAPVDGASADRPDGSVAFADITAILNARCITCHQPRDAGPMLLDMKTADGLYMRLTSPLPATQEGTCGFGDAGTDGGDGGPPNRQAITPGDPGASLLYLKVTGTQPNPGVNAPAGCGQQMPRIPIIGADGGPTGMSVGCNQADGGAAANCLSLDDTNTIMRWIVQGAPSN